MVSELRRNNTPVSGNVDLNLDLGGSSLIGQRIIQRMRGLADDSRDFSGFTFGECVDGAGDVSAGCIPAEVGDFEMIYNDCYRDDDRRYREAWDEERADNSDLESSCNECDGRDRFESAYAEEECDSNAVRSDCEYDGDRLLLPGLDELRRSLGDSPLSGVLEAVNQNESFGAADIRALAILLGDSQSISMQEEDASEERNLEDNKGRGVKWSDKQVFVPREGKGGGRYIR